jgi:endonuclease/exonuclease/phosphatase (EEP) superfamily protein YafD
VLNLDRLFLVFAGGSAVASALPLLSHMWWVFDLFSHFRVQYLALSLLVVSVFAVRKRWRGVVSMLPFFVLNAHAIAAARTTTDPATGSQPTFSILNVNVNSTNSDYSAVVDLIEATSPDVAVLIEINDSWRSALSRLDPDYPYHVEQLQNDNFGIGLISRYPLRDTEIRDLLGTPAVSALVEVGEERLRIVGAHLRPPLSAEWSAARNRQLEELGRWIDMASEPTAVVGDFNITAYSPIFSAWLDEHGLSTPARSTSTTISWPTSLPLLGILIDHYVTTDDIVIDDMSRGPAIGSDHYPQFATLSLRENK